MKPNDGVLNCLWTGIRAEIKLTKTTENESTFSYFVRQIDMAMEFYRKFSPSSETLEREYAELKAIERQRKEAV